MRGEARDDGSEIDGCLVSFRGGEKFAEDPLHGGREDVHAKEAQIVTRAQAGDGELLLGFGGRGFFEDGFDLVKTLRGIHELAANGAVVGQLAFVRRLHC